ncbi:MAG: nucleotide exchange factor GrpE, partial [Candidatus Nanohalarchaeota archaeon]
DTELKTLEKKLQKRDQLISDYINLIKRSQADFENYKKRTEKEREYASQRELEKLVSNLLPILDTLERALVASKKNHDLESLINGIEMTQKNLCSILKKEGLEKIDCMDKEFDPNMHEAIITIESKDRKDNTVCEELEKGYTFKNKLIRASKVKVIKNE